MKVKKFIESLSNLNPEADVYCIFDGNEILISMENVSILGADRDTEYTPTDTPRVTVHPFTHRTNDKICYCPSPNLNFFGKCRTCGGLKLHLKC